MPQSGPWESAHDIRRFESAVWSLFVLSENASLPDAARAACRMAAELAVAHLAPGAPQVAGLVEMAVQVGGGEIALTEEVLLARLRALGWQGPASALRQAPPALVGAPPRNLVSERRRQQALENILREIEGPLSNKAVALPKREELIGRLQELRKGPGDVRTKTERAWQLLEVVERNLVAGARAQAPKD